MKVVYEDRGKGGIWGNVEFEEIDYLKGNFSSLSSMKNILVERIAKSFDESIEQNLGITFPYTIGEITFYSLPELNNFILAKQKSID